MPEPFPSEILLNLPESRERISGREARAAHLNSIQTQGFDTDVTAQKARERILDIGLPVDNYTSLLYKRNHYGREAQLLGSWGIGRSNFGEFSIYDLLDRQVPEKQIGTIAHEGAHAATPLRKENAFLFGSEEKRQEAESFARAAAEQTIITHKFLNGYHRFLYNQFVTGEISKDTFTEETWAITSELAITNRAHLEQVQYAQHNQLDHLKATGALTRHMRQLRYEGLISSDTDAINPPSKVYFMSTEDQYGRAEYVLGVDKALINLIDGVHSYRDLKHHVRQIKEKHYSDDSFKVFFQRENYDYQPVRTHFPLTIYMSLFSIFLPSLYKNYLY